MESAVILLVLTFATPPNMHDIVYKVSMISLDDCWKEAKRFVDNGIPDRLKDQHIIGVAAACYVEGNTGDKL